MKRSKASWVSVAAIVAIMTWAQVGFAQTDGNTNPAVGTWKMNLTKSKYDPPNLAPKSQTITTEASGKNGIKQTAEGVNADGGKFSRSFTANYDGKDYPYITGVGPSGGDAISMKRIDAYTVDTVEKKAGKVVRTSRTVYSKDGKLRTITSKGTGPSGQPTNNVTVYDRQ